MALIKKDELNAMDAEALKKKLSEIEVEIALNMGAIRTAGKPSNNKFRELKRTRAQIKFLLSKKGIRL